MNDNYMKTILSGVKEWTENLTDDWNENDPTKPGYIENRPFYTGDPVETVFVKESTVPFTDSKHGLYIAQIQLNSVPTVGETYKVSWDGSVYECTCVRFSGEIVIGNLSIAGAGSDTGEPFVVGVIGNGEAMIYTLDTSASHTFSISGFVVEIVKIEEKYLPDALTSKISTLSSDVSTLSSDVSTLSNNASALSKKVSTLSSNVNSLSSSVNAKMNNSNPTGSGSFSLNRKANTTIGSSSFAEGYETTASGRYSHAEGNGTTASGISSHAEGEKTTASGKNSHTEGNGTTASGIGSHAEGEKTTTSGRASHAEGFQTTASGKNSHTEGYFTIASSDYQHVQGKYNIEDSSGTYADIVGNGKLGSRSNAYTLDWEGNAWYSGTIEGKALILPSSTAGSTKKFKITVDDSGTIAATEVV